MEDCQSRLIGCRDKMECKEAGSQLRLESRGQPWKTLRGMVFPWQWILSIGVRLFLWGKHYEQEVFGVLILKGWDSWLTGRVHCDSYHKGKHEFQRNRRKSNLTKLFADLQLGVLGLALYLVSGLAFAWKMQFLDLCYSTLIIFFVPVRYIYLMVQTCKIPGKQAVFSLT